LVNGHYHADDHAVAQTYAELYLQLREPKMIQALRARFDDILAHPRTGTLDFTAAGNQERWSWCDALYMAPPAWLRLWTVSGDQRYLDFAVREWWATSDYLYDKDEHLYYRDSNAFGKHEANGAKVFWGRGNGWVMGGLVRMLEFLPPAIRSAPASNGSTARWRRASSSCSRPMACGVPACSIRPATR
jgi:unsaturated rhamnogalacturonyl hydrolase